MEILPIHACENVFGCRIFKFEGSVFKCFRLLEFGRNRHPVKLDKTLSVETIPLLHMLLVRRRENRFVNLENANVKNRQDA